MHCKSNWVTDWVGLSRLSKAYSSIIVVCISAIFLILWIGELWELGIIILNHCFLIMLVIWGMLKHLQGEIVFLPTGSYVVSIGCFKAMNAECSYFFFSHKWWCQTNKWKSWSLSNFTFGSPWTSPPYRLVWYL